MSKLGKFAAACAAVLCAFGAEAGSLPAEYQEVEYIESTGTQYVDVDINATAACGFVLEVKPTGYSNYDSVLSGVCDDFTIGLYQNANAYYFRWRGEDITRNGSFLSEGFTCIAVTNGVFTQNSVKMTVVDTGSALGKSSGNVYVFNNSGKNRPAKARVQRVMIFGQDGSVTAELVPCYERANPDNVGFYDCQRKRFLPNAGSGVFGVGSIVDTSDMLRVTGSPADIGDVIPVYGVSFGYAVDSQKPCSASANWTNAEETVAATCLGYKVYTNDIVYVEGPNNSFTYMHPDCEMGAKLVWQWAVEYKVTIPSVAGLTVTEPSRWVASGGTVEFPIECDEAHAVSAVSGGVYRDGKIVVENVTAPVEVTVTLGNAWYVSTDGDDAAGGRSFDTAFATIGHALDVAQTGDTVCLSEGTFYVDNTLTVDKGVTLKGAGRDATFINGSPIKQSNVRCVYVDNAEAMLASLTVCGVTNSIPSGTGIDGLGVYLKNGALDDVHITKMYSDAYYQKAGTGLYVVSGRASNCLVDDNGAAARYGSTQGIGIYATGGTIEDCVISNNWRNGGEFLGGGVYLNGAATLRRCRIVDNSSMGKGNGTSNTRGIGLYVNNSSALVEDCEIVGNGIHGVTLANGTVRNCLIAGHATTSSDYTAGVEMSNGTLQNCTIWGNGAPNAFAGLKMTGGTAVNNIVFGNGTLGSATVSGGTFNTNVIDVASTVTTSKEVGNMKADPLLTDPENGDFSLDFASPAIDAAAPIAAIAHDLAGVARPQGAAPDIGCYELVLSGGSLKCAIIVNQVNWKAGTAPTATARVLGASGEVTYQWYVDDALRSDLEGPSPTFTDLAAGRHTVRLVVSDGTGSDEYTFENAFDLHPTEVWVAEDSGNAYPYASPETAATSLNAAVAAVWSDAETVAVVHIGEGTFYLDAELNLTMPYELRGSGRDKTIVNGCRLPNEFRAAKLGNAKSVLKDLMVTGCTNEVDGSGVYMTAGTLDNVWVYRNQDHKYNLKNGAGIYMTGGTVTNSLIELNSVKSGYGSTQGVGIYMTGGTVVDSVIRDNFRDGGELYGVGVAMCGAGKLIRCVISGNNTNGKGNNTNNTRGIGLYMTGNGTVENCNFVSNGIHGVQMSNGTLRNCLVWGHETTSANYTAGIEQSGGTVENCTVSGNAAPNAFAGLKMTGGTMVNTIVYGNGSAGCALVSGGTFNNNIVDDKSVITTTTASDNVVSDPKLKDPANGDFTIGFDSPAVDKGQTRTGYAIDYAGTERPQGEAWDIGAYEYAPSGEELNCAIIIGTTQWRGDQRPTAQARVVGGSGNYTYEWYVDGVLSSEDSAEPAFEGLACGTHALKLVVSDGTLTAEDENTAAFTLMPGEVWVDAKGSDTFPYDTSAKAAHSVNAAFAAVWSKADSTGVVHIAAGTYPVTATLTMTTPYKLLGAGRDVTTLVGPDLTIGTRMITMNSAGSVVRDLSLSGCTNQVEGMVVRMTTGWLENVRIHHNYEGYYGISIGLYPGLGISMTDGVVTNCLVDSNECPSGYGNMSGIGISISGGLVVDTVIRDNGRPCGESHAMGVQMTGGTLRRCVISGNTTDGYGDKDDRCHGVGLGVEGWGYPLIENCVIVSNGHSAVTLGNGTLRNCLVTGHKASRANLPAGVNATDGSGKIINCTLAGNTNTASETWVDLRMTAGTMKNTIAVAAEVTGGTEECNCLNQPVDFKRGYRLKGTGANKATCINQGDNSVWDGIAEPKDLMGNPRIIEETVDLGCFEYEPTGFSLIVR